jgi:hypothetical protein
MGGLRRMECQDLFLGNPYKDSWFEVDWWVIKIFNALEVAIHLVLGVHQWRCSYIRKLGSPACHNYRCSQGSDGRVLSYCHSAMYKYKDLASYEVFFLGKI